MTCQRDTILRGGASSSMTAGRRRRRAITTGSDRSPHRRSGHCWRQSTDGPGCACSTWQRPGDVAAAAAERGASVVGADFSAAVVAAATVRYPNVEFREADAEALPFPDASFDAVTINFGMNHFAGPDRASPRSAACYVLVGVSRSQSGHLGRRSVSSHGWCRSLAIRRSAIPRRPPTRLRSWSSPSSTVRAAGFLSPTS